MMVTLFILIAIYLALTAETWRGYLMAGLIAGLGIEVHPTGYLAILAVASLILWKEE